MAYLPDLTAPRSWEPEAPQRHSRVFGVIVALFFALLLCAASALATAVYLEPSRCNSCSSVMTASPFFESRLPVGSSAR